MHRNVSYCCKICGKNYSRKDKLKVHYVKCKKQDEQPQLQQGQHVLEMIDFFDDKPSSVYQKTFESYIEEEKSKEICQICSKTFA